MCNVFDIISDSFKPAFKHKMLWVFALMLASGGMNFGNISRAFPDSSPASKKEQSVDFPSSYESTGMPVESFDNLKESVLGAVTNAEEEYTNAFKKTFAQQLLAKSPPYILLVAVTFVAMLIFAISLGLIIKSWALGAFFGGINDVITDTAYTLRQLATYGRISARELVKYQVFYTGIWLVGTLLFFLPLIVALVLKAYVAAVLLGIPFIFFWFVIFFIVLNFSDNFATRFICLKGYKFTDAFKAGLVTFKNNFAKSLGLGLLNLFISIGAGIGVLLVVGIPLAIAAVILGAFFVSTDLTSLSVVVQAFLVGVGVFLSVPLIFVFLLGTMCFGAYMKTYAAFTWSKLFNCVTFGEKNAKNY